ncbi:MAG: hypothetical protein AB7E52_08975, partial [Bdellovibrionales bacterium]
DADAVDLYRRGRARRFRLPQNSRERMMFVSKFKHPFFLIKSASSDGVIPETFSLRLFSVACDKRDERKRNPESHFSFFIKQMGFRIKLSFATQASRKESFSGMTRPPVPGTTSRRSYVFAGGIK